MFFSDYFTDVTKALKQFSDEMLKAANDDDSDRVSEIKLMRIVGDDIHPVATWKRHQEVDDATVKEFFNE